jgi:transposase InsO family protein
VKWSYFYLDVILDIFSRRVVGWRIEHAESASQFKELFIDAMGKNAVPHDQLTLHADRGGPMKAKTTALMWWISGCSNPTAGLTPQTITRSKKPISRR